MLYMRSAEGSAVHRRHACDIDRLSELDVIVEVLVWMSTLSMRKASCFQPH